MTTDAGTDTFEVELGRLIAVLERAATDSPVVTAARRLAQDLAVAGGAGDVGAAAAPPLDDLVLLPLVLRAVAVDAAESGAEMEIFAEQTRRARSGR